MRLSWKMLLLMAVPAQVLPQAPALAWDDTGHMVVAAIAYQRLTPAAKERVDQLLVPSARGRGLVYSFGRKYDPITIAVWMDDLRDNSLDDPLKEWHFINANPIFAGIPARRLKVPRENVRERLKISLKTLQRLRDFQESEDKADDKASAEALGYLFHLIGDVHQPLHCATRYSAQNPDGDLGGNRFFIKVPPAAKVSTYPTNNLHAFWDKSGGLFGFQSVERPATRAGLDEAGRAQIKKFAGLATAAFPDTDPRWRDLNPDHWVRESNNIARTFAYIAIDPGDLPSPAYTQNAQQWSALRLSMAGYRLAELLNRLYR